MKFIINVIGSILIYSLSYLFGKLDTALLILVIVIMIDYKRACKV